MTDEPTNANNESTNANFESGIMTDELAARMSGLIDAYLISKKNNQLGVESNFHERMEGYREWLRDNILNYAEHNYTDAEFADKFLDMFNHTYIYTGFYKINVQSLYGPEENRIAIRQSFEHIIDRINNPDQDPISIYQELTSADFPDQIELISSGLITALINAKHPDIPPINNPTEDFFVAIDEPLPKDPVERLRQIYEFTKDMINLSDGKLNLDDVNLIFWYIFKVEAGQNYMQNHFHDSYEKALAGQAKSANGSGKPKRRTAKKILSPEERLAKLRAELQEAHDQAKLGN